MHAATLRSNLRTAVTQLEAVGGGGWANNLGVDAQELGACSPKCGCAENYPGGFAAQEAEIWYQRRQGSERVCMQGDEGECDMHAPQNIYGQQVSD